MTKRYLVFRDLVDYPEAKNLAPFIKVCRNMLVAKMIGCTKTAAAIQNFFYRCGKPVLDVAKMVFRLCGDPANSTFETLNKHVPLLLKTADLPALIAKYSGQSQSQVNESIELHTQLNPKLWSVNGQLKPKVHDQILKVADYFIAGLAKDGIKFKLKDIRLVGSNCSYNYTQDSDLDVHLIVDKETLTCPDNLYPLLYSAYRSIFNKNLDIKFYDIPVELYVEVESADKVQADVKSNGIYSVLNNKWIKEPAQSDIPSVNKEEFEKLFKK